MQYLKERKPLLIKLLAIILLVLLCYNLPSLPFYLLCLKEDIFRQFNTEILISACNKDLRVVAVPGGEVLFVAKYHADNAYLFDNAYLLDLRTGEKRDVPNDPLLMATQGEFLSSELVWLGGVFSRPEASPGYRPDYILDLNDGQRYELINLNQMPLLDNKFDPKYYAYFQSAEQVFILQKDYMVIALSHDFRQNPEGNVIYFKPPPNGDFEDGEMLEKLMNDLGVKYKIVDFSYSNYYDMDILSPTGKYVVRDDGIYLSGTFTRVIKRDMSAFKGWYYDESGVVIGGRGYYLINLGSAFGISFEYYYVPSPVLKLRLPKQ